MNPTFKAAASYFGLPADQVIDGEIADVWGEDITVLMVKIKLSNKDIQGVKDRLQGMETIAKYRQPQPEPSYADMVVQLIEVVGKLIPAIQKIGKEQGEIGAAVKQMAEQFDRVSSGGTVLMVDIDGDIKDAKKLAEASHGILSQPEPVGDIKREVKHVDVPEVPADEPQQVVWLNHTQASVEQLRFSSDQKVIGDRVHYAVNVQMLTPEQRKEAGLP